MKRLEVLLCCGVILFGLLVALYSAYQRVRADAAYKDVLVLVDWHDLAALPPLAERSAEQGRASGSDPAPAARSGAAKAGIVPAPLAPGAPVPRASGEAAAPATGVANAPAAPARAPLLSEAHWRLLSALPGAMLSYGEETLGTLTAQGVLIPAKFRTVSPAYMVPSERYADDVYHGAVRHGYYVERSPRTDYKLTLWLPDLPAEDFSLLPVCWLSEVRQAAREHGVPLLLRPGGSEFLGAQGIARTFDFAAGQPLMLFQGPTVPGYPGQLELTAEQLKRHRMRFGWVEFDEQDGGADLARRVAPYVVRVHGIPPEELVDLSVADAVARLVRAVRERDIRCLYLRPFCRGAALGDTAPAGYRARLFEVNGQYFAALRDGLAQYGFRIAADAPPPQSPGTLLDALRRFSSAWAAGAAAILLLLLWFPAWPRWVWWALRAANVLVAVGAIRLNMLYTPALLLCALAFPLLGFWLALWLYQRVAQADPPWHPRRLLMALVALLAAGAASMLGGLLIHGGLWDAATLLKVGQFRGVTPALGVPILLLAGYAWQAETLQDAFNRATLRLAPYWTRFMALWTAPIRYGDVAFIMIALGAVGIVLLRSGNDSPLEVLSVETWFRGGLEQLFSVRPRTKELLGHPLLVVFLLSLVWRNRLALLFGLAALLGQVSILNTFCHLHTPLLLTMQRVALGLGLGLINGALWGALLLLGTWLGAKLRRQPAPTE